jgi:TolA-binding protein
VKDFNQHVQLFSSSKLRPKAIYRLHRIYKDQLKDEAKAQTALATLQKDYPDWVQTLPSTA